jgi:hypothetical protein
MQRLEVIPLGHAPDRVHTQPQARFDFVPVVTKRRDAPHAGNDNALHHTIPPLTPIT